MRASAVTLYAISLLRSSPRDAIMLSAPRHFSDFRRHATRACLLMFTLREVEFHDDTAEEASLK